MRRIIGCLGCTTLLLLAAAATAGPVPPARHFSDAATAPQRLAAPAAAARLAAPAAAHAVFTDPVAAALAIGDRLVDIQSDVTEDNAGNGAVDADGNDGGWGWNVTGTTAHPSSPSFENLYGPIARGLIEAAILTGDTRLAVGAGDVFAGISRPGNGALGRPYYRIFDGDIVTAYVRWSGHTVNPALLDTSRVRHDQEMSVRGGAGGYARAIRNGRWGQGIVGLWPWDAHLFSNDCDALRGAYPASAAQYGAEVDSVAQALLDDMNGLLGTGGWIPADFTQNYHQIGLAGALRVFDASPRSDDDAMATAMRDSLVNGQLPDGSWGISYGGTFYGQDLQTTAYAVLALMEYSRRHGDAVARAAAVDGQQFLLGYVAANGVVDDGYGEYAETSAEVAQALLTGDPVGPVAPAGCISIANPCVAVPVNITRTDATPMRGFSVTLTLSANLQLCPTGIVTGPYLPAANYQVLNPSPGVYVVDGATLGLPCGATGSGTLFTLHLQSASPTGIGTVTVNSVLARDCANAPVSAIPGPPASITIDQTAPAAIADLAAVQVRLGNPPGQRTGITVSYTLPAGAATVEVYRAPFGQYPEYDDNGGTVPAVPTYPPGAPWVLTTLTASGQADIPPTRDFWYYVAFAIDLCGNVSAVSNRTLGNLDYHLGDVSNGLTPGTGDNLVSTADISLLGAHYGITLGAGDPFNYLDAGPTTDYSVHARPTTDNRVNFEDLMMFAINHGQVAAPQDAPAARAVAGADAFGLRVPEPPAVGETFAVPVTLSGAGVIQGVSLTLRWDPARVVPVGVEAGELLQRQGREALVMTPAPGTVDVALLGPGAGLWGDGELARVLFRVVATGDAGIVLEGVTARDAANRPVGTGAPGTVVDPPARTELGPAFPNPARGATALQLSLASEARVRVTVYDLGGRRVRTLIDEVRPAGRGTVGWDGRDDAGRALGAGLYVVRLEGAGTTASRRVMLTR
jgi:hypothetical protein